jgi:putative endonuclease
LDIIARDGPTVVFVEVKTRESCEFGAGGESVNSRKRRRMADIALDYLARNRLTELPCRFDVMSIDMGNGTPRIELYQNAFDFGG